MPEKKDILALISRYRTALMGFAALWVMLYHEWISLFGGSVLGYAERFITGMGYYGVDIFFFLSGMGLVFAIGKYPLKEFYKRRFVRVLIPYLIAVTVCWFTRQWSPAFYFKTLVGYNFWAVDIYTVLWFIYAIMTVYLLFPLYYALLRRFSRKGLFTALALVVWVLLSAALGSILRTDLYGFLNRVPIFLTGVLAGEWAKEKKQILFGWKHLAISIFALLLGVVFFFLTYYRKMPLIVPLPECGLPSYLVALSGTCILAQTLSWLDDHWKSMGLLANRTLKFFGAMSLELYCMQDITLGAIKIAMADRFPSIIINLVNFWVITVAAMGLRWLCLRIGQALNH